MVSGWESARTRRAKHPRLPHLRSQIKRDGSASFSLENKGLTLVATSYPKLFGYLQILEITKNHVFPHQTESPRRVCSYGLSAARRLPLCRTKAAMLLLQLWKSGWLLSRRSKSSPLCAATCHWCHLLCQTAGPEPGGTGKCLQPHRTCTLPHRRTCQ